MKASPINVYVNDYLAPLLDSFEVDSSVISKVANDIENRLLSLISHWNNIDFRRTILITGLEEAYFYNPPNNLEVRELVVVAIRNSLIEDISSTNRAAKKIGLTKPIINDTDIKVITEQAINFWSKVDLDKLSTELSYEQNNIYAKLQYKYPVTWRALSYLSSWFNTYQVYEPLIKPQFQLDSHNLLINMKNNVNEVIESGLDPNFDDKLMFLLNSIVNGKISYFFVDSFKMISRNPEKLFKVIEIVLRANAAVVMCNFYISNGYVARRKELLRPAHTTNDVIFKLNNLNGLRKTHREALKIVRNEFT